MDIVSTIYSKFGTLSNADYEHLLSRFIYSADESEIEIGQKLNHLTEIQRDNTNGTRYLNSSGFHLYQPFLICMPGRRSFSNGGGCESR